VGNAYLVGKTLSADFPTKNALDPTYHSPDLEIVVTKLDPSGTGLVYSTYLGGMNAGNAETALTFAVDPAGNAYVGGDATADFPVKAPLQTTGSLFVTKLTPGGALAYSTRFGGSGTDYFNGLKVDAAGYAYLAGATNSTDFPTKNALYPAFQGGAQDGFVAKLAPSGASLVFSTYFGSPGADTAMAAAPDASGRVYVTGGTDSTSFPVKGAPQSTYGGGTSDGFIAAIAADGSTLLYSTYIGGSAFDQGTAIAVDGPGNAYVTGTSTATSLQGPVFNNFPVTVGTVYSPLGASNFTAKIHPGGATYAYSALGPGSGDIWIDAAGNAYLPVICGPLVLNPDATSTSQITLDPGGQNCPPDEVMALDTGGNVYFTGYVTDGGITPTPGAFQGAFAGGSGDAYVIKLGSHPLPDAGAIAAGGDAGAAPTGSDAGVSVGSEAGARDGAVASGDATGLGDAVAPDDGATADAASHGPSANGTDGGTGAGGSGCSVTPRMPGRPWALAPLAALAVLVVRRRARRA
jgi:MYXO-CTERM domain-containing protein